MHSSNSTRTICLSDQTPLYLGSCLKLLVAEDSKERTFVSFSYDVSKESFIIDNEKKFDKNTSKDTSSTEIYTGLPLEHGRNCVALKLTQNSDVYSFQQTETYMRIACSPVIVDSKDNVLLSRRNKKLKTYPGAWVNPGGRLDPNETLEQCCLREMHEEVGIEVTSQRNNNGEVKYYYNGKECEFKPLMVFESLYPTNLDIGLPKVQYILLFFYVKLGCEHSEVNVKLQEIEVDKAIWIPTSYLMDSSEFKKNNKDSLPCTSVSSSGVQKSDSVLLESIDGFYPNDIKEGLAYGHFLAIKEYDSIKSSTKMNVEGH